MKIKNIKQKGFSLIELMVSMTIFAVVMVICMGSIVSVLDANQKSQTLRAVMDNMNFTLESMTRTIRFGENYHCSDNVGSPYPTYDQPLDCPNSSLGVNPSSTLYLKTSNGDAVEYSLSGGKIIKTQNGVASKITSDDVTVTNLTFYVRGSYAYNSGNDVYQPRVIIVVKGYSGLVQTTKTEFVLETTASQRKFDFQ